MRRRAVLAALAGAALAPALGVSAARAESARVALLSPLSEATAARNIAAFRSGLTEQGLAEGRDVVVTYRFAEGSSDRAIELARELVAARPAVVVAGSPVPVRAVAEATRSIPIVFIGVPDPIGLGLVRSLARPGTNATGQSIIEDGAMWGKRLGLLKELVPKLSRVAVLGSTEEASDDLLAAVPELREEARRLEIALQLETAGRADQLDGVFTAAARGGAEALLVSHRPLFNANRARVAELAAQVRLPAIYGFAEFVHAGGLAAYAPSLPAQYRRAAAFVARILRGAAPADLAVEEPTQFELSLNLKAAKGLGLEIPTLLLARAGDIVE